MDTSRVRPVEGGYEVEVAPGQWEFFPSGPEPRFIDYIDMWAPHLLMIVTATIVGGIIGISLLKTLVWLLP
jgi:hypothetical protein